MLTIRITEFAGYGFEEFIMFLKEAEDNIYEIVIPKETAITNSPPNAIAKEFFLAAFVGQRLHEISSELCYVTTAPDRPGKFAFTIKTTMIDKLANLLFQISGAFGNSEVIEPLDFVLEVNRFIAAFKKRRVVCQDIFDIANKYHSENSG